MTSRRAGSATTAVFHEIAEQPIDHIVPRRMDHLAAITALAEEPGLTHVVNGQMNCCLG
jgi:hypothetical protein